MKPSDYARCLAKIDHDKLSPSERASTGDGWTPPVGTEHLLGTLDAMAALLKMKLADPSAEESVRVGPRVTTVRVRGAGVEISRGGASFTLSFDDIALASRIMRKHLLVLLPPEVNVPPEGTDEDILCDGEDCTLDRVAPSRFCAAHQLDLQEP